MVKALGRTCPDMSGRVRTCPDMSGCGTDMTVHGLQLMKVDLGFGLKMVKAYDLGARLKMVKVPRLPSSLLTPRGTFIALSLNFMAAPGLPPATWHSNV